MDKSTKEQSYKVAVASNDGIVVNQHFGRADTFYIYEVTQSGQYELLEKRTVTPVCNGGNHDEQALKNNIGKLKDCKYLLAARIGIGAVGFAEQSGITPMELPGMIADAIGKLITLEQLQNIF